MKKLLAVALACCGALGAQTSNPLAGNASAAAAGAEVFRAHCGSCHGNGGHGGQAPDLSSGSYVSGDRDSDLFATITKGIPGTDMGPYGERLIPDDVWRIITFLRAAKGSPATVPGDRAKGEALFWGKGGCGNCHAVGTRGSMMGPGLSNVGRLRGLEYLRGSLLVPSAYVVNGYGGLTVTLKDGTRLRGVERSLDDFSAVLQDFSGKVHSFDRSELASVQRDTESLMPAYGAVFSAEEIKDLVAYLASLGKAEGK